MPNKGNPSSKIKKKMKTERGQVIMSSHSAFKVLELGFKWGCEDGQGICLANMTEQQILQAFRAELAITGRTKGFS